MTLSRCHTICLLCNLHYILLHSRVLNFSLVSLSHSTVIPRKHETRPKTISRLDRQAYPLARFWEKIMQYFSPLPLIFRTRVPVPWNNGKEVPRWGVTEIQKMSPSTTGRCYCCHYLSSYWSHEISADQSPSRNCIRRPDLVERIGSYLGTSFPLFHAKYTQ